MYWIVLKEERLQLLNKKAQSYILFTQLLVGTCFLPTFDDPFPSGLSHDMASLKKYNIKIKNRKHIEYIL